jgi:STE24 endopeptidase
VQVLLVHRPQYDDWTFPKGKRDAGESDEQTAAREVEEETGFVPDLGAELPSTTYLDKRRRKKQVRYWEMTVASGEFTANDEVDDVEWVGLKAARRRLSYDRDQPVLEAFAERVPALLGSDQVGSGGQNAEIMSEAGAERPVDAVDEERRAMSEAGAERPAVPSAWFRVANDPAEWFSAEELERARSYQRPLTKLRLLRTGVSLAILLAFIGFEAGPAIADSVDGWIVQLILVLVALELVVLPVNVVLDAWVDLRHDREWGLSTQTGKGLATDTVKSFVLGMVVNVALLVPLYALVRSTELWWLWGWLVVVLFSVGLGFLFPVVIAPIFNRFDPLQDEDLAGRIQGIAGKAGVTISGAFVADESKRSRRDNAYVAGLGPSRRVVLYDTILEHPPEVVEQVVAHEVGHWRLKHLSKQIPMMAVLTFVVFLLLDVVAGWDALWDWAGVEAVGDVPAIGNPAGLPLLVLLIQLGFSLVGGVTAFVSRAFERQADIQALELLEAPSTMIDMQRRLHVKNLADLDPGFVKQLRATHPPAAERMTLTQRWAQSQGIDVVVPPPPPTSVPDESPSAPSEADAEA